MILNDARYIVSHQPFPPRMSSWEARPTAQDNRMPSVGTKEHPSKALPKRFSSEKSNGNDSTPQGGVASVFFHHPWKVVQNPTTNNVALHLPQRIFLEKHTDPYKFRAGSLATGIQVLDRVKPLKSHLNHLPTVGLLAGESLAWGGL